MHFRNASGAIGVFIVVLVFAVNPVRGEMDDFEDGARDTATWSLRTKWEGSLAETNGHLEYTSPGTSTGSPSEQNYQYYVLNRQLAYDESWAVTLDVYVGAFDGTARDHLYGMEISVFETADDADQIWFARERGSSSGTGFTRWGLHKETADAPAGSTVAVASGSTGVLKLVWDGGDFDAYFDEGSGFQALRTDLTVHDWGMDAASTFTLMIGGFDDNVDVLLNDGSRLYADNFVLIPEPASLSLLVLGALGLVRRRRR